MVERLLLMVLLLVLGFNVVWLVLAPASWWMIPAALGGWYLADLGSGLSHVLLDYVPCRTGVGLRELYFYEGKRSGPEYQAMRSATMSRVSFIQRVLLDNKIHHPRPGFLGRRTLGALLLPTIVLYAIPFGIVEVATYVLCPVPGWVVAGVAALLTGSVFSQYIHAVTHRPKVSWLVRAAQAMRLFLHPQIHAGHHTTFDRNFCLVSGWANPLVNRFFNWAIRHGWLKPAGLEPA